MLNYAGANHLRNFNKFTLLLRIIRKNQ